VYLNRYTFNIGRHLNVFYDIFLQLAEV